MYDDSDSQTVKDLSPETETISVNQSPQAVNMEVKEVRRGLVTLKCTTPKSGVSLYGFDGVGVVVGERGVAG